MDEGTVFDDNGTSLMTSEVNLTNLDCPVYEDGDDLQIAKFSFWLEGVAQCCVAICGLIGNSISAFILSRYVKFCLLKHT